MRTKILAWLLTAAMVLFISAVIPINASANGNPVCEVGDLTYDTLDAALDAVSYGGTIKLLQDIEYTGMIIPRTTFDFNLNGYTLNVINSSGPGFWADGRQVGLIGEGALNVTGSTYGVYACDGGSAEVTNATATAAGGIAVYVGDSNCSVSVLGNATANGENGIAVKVEDYQPCTATIYGNVYANGTGGIGTLAQYGGSITVMGTINTTNYVKIGSTVKTQSEYSSIADGYYIYTDGTSTVRVQVPVVCEIDSTGYETLDSALAAAENGDTIKLLTDINYTSGLLIENKSLTFDLNGFTLNISSTNDWGKGIEVGEGGILEIDETGGGELNAIGSNVTDKYGVGLSVHDGGSATVTNVFSTGYGNGAESTAGNIVIKGNVQSGANGVFAQSGGSIIIDGNVVSGGMGAIASGESSLIEIGGGITAAGSGISISAGTIRVTGDVQSSYTGVGVSFGGTAEIDGNVTVSGSNGNYGAKVYNSGTVTIGGSITAPCYISIGDVEISEGSHTALNGGYYIYTDDENTVRVKVDACIIPGCTTSAIDGGFTEFSEIDGEIYYHISNAKQLAHIKEHLNLNYIQTADIDLAEMDWTPIGVTYENPFRGIYDGNGHTISGLNVNQAAVATNKSGGLFGLVLGNAVIKNLDVSGNVSYQCSWYATSAMAGGIAAGLFSENGETPLIDNCSFEGNVTATGQLSISNNRMQAAAGGIVGYIRDGTIRNSSRKGGNVTATTVISSGSTTYANAGGITGIISSNASVLNCYSADLGGVFATNSSENYAGGISGQMHDGTTVAVSYNAGSVNATPAVGGLSSVGGISGKNSAESEISFSYWLDTCGADNQIGSDDTTSTTGRMTDTDMKATRLRDMLNSILNTVADTSLYKWQQTQGSNPTLSTVFWTTPPAHPSSSGGSSYTSPSVIVTTEESSNSTTNKMELSPKTTSGTATAGITSAIVEALLDKAKSTNGTDKDDVIEVSVDTPNNTDSLEINMKQNDLQKIVTETNANFAVTSPFISITFDDKALETISGSDSDGNVVVSAGVIDKETLSASDKAKVKSRPVYNLSVINDNTQVSHFGGGHATVLIPYELQPGENPNSVVIYYLADDGSLKTIRGHYDSVTKAVVFKTTHFSKFVIGYHPQSFADVTGDAWYKDAVEFIAAREITSGTGSNQFSPDAKLTRAQFVVLLMNAYQINTQNKGESDHIRNFSDAGNTYYTEYLLAAKGLGIVNGIGNNLFAPEKEITRQEMFVMLYNALKIIEEVPAITVEKQLTSFDDASKVATWANEALSTLVKAGIVSGSNNNLNPTSSTTRAEIAQVLYNLLSK